MGTYLSSQIEAFDRKRRALLDELEDLDIDSLNKKPLADKWCLLEIAEHLAVAEREILGGLPDPSTLIARRRRIQNRLMFQIVMVVLKLSIPVKMPSPNMAPSGTRSLAEVRAFWDENQRWIRAYARSLQASGDPPVFIHPVAGPMSLRQTVEMGGVHLGTHLKQVRRLQRSI